MDVTPKNIWKGPLEEGFHLAHIFPSALVHCKVLRCCCSTCFYSNSMRISIYILCVGHLGPNCHSEAIFGDVPYRHMAPTCVSLAFRQQFSPNFWLGSPARGFFPWFGHFVKAASFDRHHQRRAEHRFRCQCQASVRCAEFFDVHKTKPNPKERPQGACFLYFSINF